MAKKNKGEQQNTRQEGVSKPESFTHGMVSDLDPHFQLSGSYSDAKNIRLTNSEGDTFTVENIEGNSLFVDLADFEIEIPSDQGSNSNYPTFYDRGPSDNPLSDNLKLDNRCSIVGHVSYSNKMLLMIVGRFDYNRGDGTPFAESKDRTIFLMVYFDHNFKVTKVTDLRVCYDSEGLQYPDLNMSLDVPVRIEHIVENESISRIYWTDNINPLRTLNINQGGLHTINKTSLDITPLMEPSQVILDTTLSGSLPVGVYQYTYKYISENGGESTFSPLSNMYHVSDQNFGNSTTYAGGPLGNLGTQGFQLSVKNVDVNFEYIELYSLFYDVINSAPRVAVVARNKISGSSTTFQHTSWNNEIQNGLEEVLIESNTFDVCKDIAIKDNILFAANLRQKRNFISEKEWNVKILRYRIATGNSNRLDAMLTTNDPQIKHYKLNASGDPVSINSGLYQYSVTDVHGLRCGYGELLGDPNGMYPATGNQDHFNYDGSLNIPMWTTNISNQRGSAGNGTNHPNFSNKINTYHTYKYLADKMTVGGESYNYATNGLGGCRISFGVEEKIADISQNAWSSPFVSSVNTQDNLETDFGYFNDSGTPQNLSNTFKASMSLGGSKDPHLAGNRRGYQRGEIYRFGVQVYDLNGAPGNVLWIGDVETPHMYDVHRSINIKNRAIVGASGYNPFRQTINIISGTSGTAWNSLVDRRQIGSHNKIKDYRLSYIYGHVVPPVDVEWFSQRSSVGSTSSFRNTEAYVREDGEKRHFNEPTTTANQNHNFGSNVGVTKGMPAYRQQNGGPGQDGDNGEGMNVSGAHDDTHYLYDLCVNFEFIIPSEVCKKISGFRVVRAERTEEDRRVVQQGLLNQTAQYGNAALGQKYGYSNVRFSQKDNEAFGDDPVFVNGFDSTGGVDPTLPEQPEYNVYLNGYLGLAENSYMAYYDANVTNGKVTTGGSTDSDGKVFYWPEREDMKKVPASGEYGHVRRSGDNSAEFGGPMTWGKHRRHYGYFGGYDKIWAWGSNGKETASFPTTGNNGVDPLDNRNRHEIDGSIFTLDSPDSAFGIRPYVYREGDMLRIDDYLKLSDSIRYEDTPQGKPRNYLTHCRDLIGSGYRENDWSSTTDDAEEWTPKSTGKDIKDALFFASKKEVDKDYCVLIGKYYSYDPYFAIGCEIDGGAFAGEQMIGDGVQHAERQYGWQLPIASSKEISDGEIVPSGFFKYSKRISQGFVSGFSNNTLGFVTKSYHSGKKSWYNTFSAVFPELPYITGTTSGNVRTVDPIEADYTYDTVSTMQMGLRSILIEVDSRVSAVRKSGPDSSFFEQWYGGSGQDSWRKESRYSAWFAPINISALYEHGSWRAETSTGTNSGTTHNGYDNPLRSGFLTSRAQKGGAALGSEEHDGNGVADHTAKSRQYVPFKLLCSIVRKITPYGGYNKGSIEKTRYIPCGNFHPILPTNDERQGHVSQVFGGDTFVNLYSHQKTSSPYMKKSASRFQLFPVESYVNTDMRSGLTLNAGDTVVGKNMNQTPYSNDWLYNSIYSQENNIKSALVLDEGKFEESLNLPYEIAYSNTKILGQKSDAFRQFPINQFHDMEGLYGEINRIINFKNEIYVLQDNAFAKLLVNPLSMLSDDSGTSLFTGTGETVENHIYISTKYGTRHRFSVTTSEKSLYFVDSNFGRLFKYDTEKLISLGDALGQRNYLKYIIKEWEKRTHRMCNSHNPPVNHGTRAGMLDSKSKPTGSRNYLADNPLSFLGICSVYDYDNKELLVTFHNSSWSNKNDKRQTFARTSDNHSMGSSRHGEPIGISETLVYSEAINAFVSKYSVAPPQWLVGGRGSFLVTPENEINVVSIANFGPNTGLNSNVGGNYGSDFPYSEFGSSVQTSSYESRDRRCNPLKLWLWDKHNEQKKTNFFGRKDSVVKSVSGLTSTINTSNTNTVQGSIIEDQGYQYVADESYIVKIINSEAASSKVFDNAKIVMTPDYIDYSTIDYTTDITHDTINIKSVLDNKTELLDEAEQLVINRRWNFDGTMHGWTFRDSSENLLAPAINPFGTITLNFIPGHILRSPIKSKDHINIIGRYNNKIRMRVRRTAYHGNWKGQLKWRGYHILDKELGQWQFLQEASFRSGMISEPAGIDDDFVIIEWDMSDISVNSSGIWDEYLIQSIRIDLEDANGKGIYDVDWIEIGGLKADKYIDGVLRAPLRTEKSTRRTRGTYAKIKYTAKTTEKFNIFAILAKYRKTY